MISRPRRNIIRGESTAGVSKNRRSKDGYRGYSVDWIGTGASNKEEKVRFSGGVNELEMAFFGGPCDYARNRAVACNNAACFLLPSPLLSLPFFIPFWYIRLCFLPSPLSFSDCASFSVSRPIHLQQESECDGRAELRPVVA